MHTAIHVLATYGNHLESMYTKGATHWKARSHVITLAFLGYHGAIYMTIASTHLSQKPPRPHWQGPPKYTTRELVMRKNKSRTPSLIFTDGAEIPNALHAAPCQCKDPLVYRSVLFAEAVGFRLAAVCSATFVALLHTGTESDVDAWRSGESEGFGDLDEIEAVDVEDAAQAVGCVGLKV
jgi:hypothetical protein